jgi:di/tricarboxylate transporter
MNLDAWLTLATLALCIGLQVVDKVSVSVGFLGAVIFLLLAGVLTPAEAFSGFSNPAPITVAALFVAARAVEKGGLLQHVTLRILGNRDRGRFTLAKMSGMIASLSAFTNNTPLVALAAPQVSDWAHHRGVPPSRYLMPLSYATILGGVVTTIGTSTNLVISGMLEADGYGSLRLFDMTAVGLPVAIVGIMLLVLLAPLLLPDRRPSRSQFEEGAREFVVSMRVVAGGPLDGVTIEDGGLRHLQGVFLFQIDRGSEVVAPVGPTMVLQADNLLSFAGQVDTILDLQRMPGLVLAEAKHIAAEGHHVMVEAVVGSQSPLMNQTLREAEFRSTYHAAVLAIHRAGTRIQGKLGSVRLNAGDTLLLLAEQGFAQRWRHKRDFLLVAELDAPVPTRSPHTWRIAAIVALILVPAALDLIPMLHATLAGAFAFIMAKVLTPAEAMESIDMDLFVMIAASLGLGTAMEKTGAARFIADGLVWTFQGAGAAGPVIGIVLATALITELVTNNAAAAIMYPVGAAVAAASGIDVRAMAVAVAVMASCSFLTPIGYQTNMMVYGLGGYRFLDYSRLGVPLTVSSILITIWLTLS